MYICIYNPRCKLERIWAVECLLNAKVDVNVVSVNQSSPLIFAVKKVFFLYFFLKLLIINLLFAIGQWKNIETPSGSIRDSIELVGSKNKQENSSSHCGGENRRNEETARRFKSIHPLLRSATELDHQEWR